jgi:hypothetical protein
MLTCGFVRSNYSFCMMALSSNATGTMPAANLQNEKAPSGRTEGGFFVWSPCVALEL